MVPSRKGKGTGKGKSNQGGKSSQPEEVTEEVRDGKNVQRDGDDADLESAEDEEEQLEVEGWRWR